MNAPVKELNLAPAEWMPADLADILTSGFTGAMLAKMLHHHFPRATRRELYCAFGIATALWSADLTIAQAEIDLLRQNGALLPGEAA